MERKNEDNFISRYARIREGDMETKVNGFTRRIEFTPAYDRRDSGKIASVNMRFLLIGDDGAVQFTLSTGWHLKHVVKEHEPCGAYCFNKSLPLDLSYDSKKPIRDWQKEPTFTDCDIMGGDCYTAIKVFDILCEHGEGALWKKLENYYQSVFKKEENHEQESN